MAASTLVIPTVTGNWNESAVIKLASTGKRETSGPIKVSFIFIKGSILVKTWVKGGAPRLYVLRRRMEGLLGA